jgi:hypothetical protein
MMNKGKQFMTDEGIAFLKNLMDVPEQQDEPTAAPDQSETDHTADYIKSLQGQINHLRKQLEVKDEQIRIAGEHMADMIKTNQHSQILLQEKDKQLLLMEQVEEPAEDQTVESQPKPKKGFMSFFRR